MSEEEMTESMFEAPMSAVTQEQLVLLVLDGSESMTWAADDGSGTKAQAVNTSMQGLMQLLQKSRIASQFAVGVVCYNDKVTFASDPTPVAEIDATGSFDPTSHGIGGTIIAAGLERAGAIATAYLAESSDVPRSVVLCLLTDGECSQPVQTKSVADAIATDKRVTIAAAYYATKGNYNSAGPDLLKSIVSHESLYSTVYTATAIREFFLNSIMTTAANGAGQALAAADR